LGKPYSLDLRKRVVAAIEGGMSRSQAAKQFGVAISTAIGWMKRVDETGSVEPGGQRPGALAARFALVPLEVFFESTAEIGDNRIPQGSERVLEADLFFEKEHVAVFCDGGFHLRRR
jgi:transposase-like protein